MSDTQAPTLQVFDFDTTIRLLDFGGLVEALRDTFRRGCDRLDRWLMTEPLSNGEANDWLLQPAWQFGRHFGIKMANIFPGNLAMGLDTIQGIFVLFDGTTGLPLAVIDGAAITLRKTAANSALAADYLARKDAGCLLMVGAGRLAPHLIEAHSAVRSYREVLIWNRTAAKAAALAARLDRPDRPVRAVADLAAAAPEADVICCATFADRPLLSGRWLKPGTHVDLVGGYRPDLREADDEAVRRARVFVDARFSTVAICGDVCQPIAAGLLKEEDIADTFQLTRGERPGRRSESEITFFKSGGGGHEDLGTAQYLLSKARNSAPPAGSRRHQ
jgi:ornithine cyclodeaminase